MTSINMRDMGESRDMRKTMDMEGNNRTIRGRRHRRTAARRKNKRMFSRFMTALVALIILFTFVFCMHIFAGQDFSSTDRPEKMYTSVLVYPGDSIDSLASDYLSEDFENADAIKREIISINHLDYDGSLTAGNHIIVPVYR